MPIVVGGLVIAVCTAVNLRGAGAVGMSSVVFTLALLSPFAVVIWKASWLPAVPVRDANAGGLDLLGGILIAMWNYMGWDNSSTVAGEVERPERTYPLAMTVAVGLVALTYVLPILAVRHLGIASSEWSTGSWAGVARAVAGPWLEIGIIVGGMFSAARHAQCLDPVIHANPTGPGRGRLSAGDLRPQKRPDRRSHGLDRRLRRRRGASLSTWASSA